MRVKKVRRIGFCLLFAVIMIGKPLAAVTADDTVTPDYQLIDDYITVEMKSAKIPGLAISIIHGNEVIYQKCYGTADGHREITADTPFGIGSVGKTFTALAIRQLINEGKLEENNTVKDFIEDFNSTYQGEAVNITIRQLLSHYSGYSEQQGVQPYLFHSKYTIEEVVTKSKDLELVRTPGSEYEYSNLNFIILGRIIELITGLSYSDYIEENIFQKLNMSNSSFNERIVKEKGLADGHTIFYGLPIKSHYTFPTGSTPAGYVFCSVEDMSHYLIAYLNGGYYNEVSVIDSNSLAEPKDPLKNGFEGGWYDELWFLNYGYPKHDLYMNTYGYNGGAPNYTSSIKINQEARYAVVVMDNMIDENDFYEGEIDSSTICHAVMEYLAYGKAPVNTILKGSFEKRSSAILFAVVILGYSLISILSVFRKRSKRLAVINFIYLFLEFILPVTAAIVIPLYNDSNWSWLIATWPEVNYIIVGAICWLILLGTLKLIIRIVHKKRQVA